MLPVYGPGALFVQRTDIALQTPINIGKANEFQLDQQFSKKELYGQNQFPLFVARGTAKFTAKAKAATVSGIALASAFYGMSLATGQQATAVSEAGTVTAEAVTVANSATFVADVGVIYQSSGLPLTLVASAPAVGEYSVAAGVYTFNTSDNGKAVFITYTYAVAASGQKLAITNPLIGAAPTFQLWYYTSTNGVPLNLQLYSCVSDKLSMAFKLEDFMMPEIDFSCFVNAAGQLGLMSFGEVS
ncbi:MAG TPA: hypothetical protein VMU87_00995 [Stellaceae bacterium]|nr:hypothetical protein [Stellaceae bacterium]